MGRLSATLAPRICLEFFALREVGANGERIEPPLTLVLPGPKESRCVLSPPYVRQRPESPSCRYNRCRQSDLDQVTW